VLIDPEPMLPTRGYRVLTLIEARTLASEGDSPM
jgi:hypothetical protein